MDINITVIPTNPFLSLMVGIESQGKALLN
jgi:hypothetical protein